MRNGNYIFSTSTPARLASYKSSYEEWKQESKPMHWAQMQCCYKSSYEEWKLFRWAVIEKFDGRYKSSYEEWKLLKKL